MEKSEAITQLRAIGRDLKIVGHLGTGDRLQVIADQIEAGGGETQKSVTDWADYAFGPIASNARVAARANEELAELLRALTVDDSHPKAAEEIADVVIVLYRLATKLGVDLHAEINRKMQINRNRVWKKDATGHGYHVREKPDLWPMSGDDEGDFEMERTL